MPTNNDPNNFHYGQKESDSDAMKRLMAENSSTPQNQEELNFLKFRPLIVGGIMLMLMTSILFTYIPSMIDPPSICKKYLLEASIDSSIMEYTWRRCVSHNYSHPVLSGLLFFLPYTLAFGIYLSIRIFKRRY